jgi:hypothetical protein
MGFQNHTRRLLMPLYRHPDTGNLLRAASGGLAGSAGCCCGTACAGCTASYSGGFEFDVSGMFNGVGCVTCADLDGLYILPGPPEGGPATCTKTKFDVTTCALLNYRYAIGAAELTFTFEFSGLGAGIISWSGLPGSGSPFDCAGLSSFSLPFLSNTTPQCGAPAAVSATSTL